jgi:hypothetical protein
MAKVPMTKEAAKALAAEVKLQSPDYALLALVPVENQDAARLWIRMKAEFTPNLHDLADAFEYCERRQSESDDKANEILPQAAKKFRVKESALDKAWIHRTWTKLNLLLRLRTAARELHGPV